MGKCSTSKRSGLLTNQRLRMHGAVFVMAICALALVTIPAGAQTNVRPTQVADAFASASRRWDVPLPVLMAVGYVESHWEQRDGQPSLDNGYGIMHIVDRKDGDLQTASTLTGLPQESIRTYSQANVEAGAALLSDISRKLRVNGQNDNLGNWYPVVASYSGASDAFVRDQYAQQVFDVIQKGQVAQLASGEVVSLGPTDVRGLPAPMAPPASPDYGPALWVPANPNNYTAGRPYGPLSYIVIHDTEGSYDSAISWFQNPSSGVSAHYVIRSSDGQITQMVREADTAYHTGVWDYNVRSIGIEHEGYMNQPGWYTEAMYQSSAALARNIADKYGIRKDRAHIIGHYQVPNQDHRDPGTYWNWDHYMSLVRNDGARAALVDNTDAGFAAVPPEIDPQHYWWVYGSGYNGSNVYVTGSVSNQQNSVNSGTWSGQLNTAGSYDIYAFIPWVDNGTPDTSNARYQVSTTGGWVTTHASQKAITDVGNGSWAHLGTFDLPAGLAQVTLSDYTGETGMNVWFDAVMWIPSNAPPAPEPTDTPVSTATTLPTPQATWTPGPCGMRFIDLPDTDWAYQYVSYLYCANVVSGYADGTFRPGAGSTRGQVVKMIALGLGWTLYNPYYPTFTDVQPGSTFYEYVETANLRQIVGGYSDGTFRPNNPLTRGQAAKMLTLADGLAPLYPQYPTFVDVPPGHWAYGYVEAASSAGFIGGYSDGTFRPDTPVTRAQVCKMLTLAIQYGPVQGLPAHGRPTPLTPMAPSPKETARPTR